MGTTQTKTREAGMWWNPLTPQVRYGGVLNIDDEKGYTLDLVFEEPSKPYAPLSANPEVIHGHTERGTKVTLCECFAGNQGRTGLGLRRLTLHSRLVCVGFWLPSLNEANIIEAYCDFRSLANWTKYDGITRNNRPDGFTIDYQEKSSKPTVVAPGVSVHLRHWCGPNSSVDLEKPIEIQRRVNLMLDFTGGKTLNETLSWVGVFENFFSLACHTYAEPKHCLLVGNFDLREMGGKSVPPYANLHRHTNFANPWKSYLGPVDHLFNEADLEKEQGVAAALQAWGEKQNQFATPMALYKSALYYRADLEQQFLTMCQALEAWHRRFREGTYLSQTKFETDVLPKLLNGIGDAVAGDMRQSLKKRLSYANEHSQAHRFLEISAEHDDAIAQFAPDWKERIKKAVEIRNHLTHFGPHSKPPPYTSNELFRLIMLLRLLFEAAALSEIGFSKATIEKLFSRNQFYRLQFGQ